MRDIGALLLAVATVTGCGMQGGSEPVDADPIVQSSDADSQAPKVTPRLWLDEDAAQMVRVVSGYSDPEDMVWVIRWEHGNLCGWVKLESPEDLSPVSWNLGLPPDRSDGVGVDDASGWLVVAMRKLSDAPGKAYGVRIEQQFTLSKGNSSETFEYDSRQGKLLRVPPGIDRDVKWKSRELSELSSSEGSGHFALKKWQDGESISWLELRLGALPSEPQSNGEPTDERQPE